MNTRKLQFGKAISAALFVLLLSVVGMKNALAQNQVATLQHGDDITMYYGQNAFVNAHQAAESGDIITLSSGNFVPTDITKGITLRGAGVAIDTIAGTLPTIIGGNLALFMEDESDHLSIEGILFTNTVSYGYLESPVFTRCNFISIDNYGSDWMLNAQFINCYINHFYHGNAYGTQFINCAVWDISSILNNTPASFVNSILNCYYSYGGLLATNSIIINNVNWHSSTCSFINCIGINLQYTVFGNGITINCATYNDYDEVFESFIGGDFSLDELFILKDEIATGFLGTDGTQVGILGGPIPYSNRPGYMVLKRCNVASQSTVDGKLSVEIEVVTEGE